jgi:hypothetical protein
VRPGTRAFPGSSLEDEQWWSKFIPRGLGVYEPDNQVIDKTLGELSSRPAWRHCRADLRACLPSFAC